MKKLLLLLALASMALTSGLKADGSAFITASTNTAQLFALGNATPATYTAKSCLGPGTILASLTFSLASGTTSTVSVYDSADSLTYSSGTVLKGTFYLDISSSTPTGLAKLDFTTQRSARTDMDGLEFKGYPVVITTGGAPVTVFAMSRKGMANKVTPY